MGKIFFSFKKEHRFILYMGILQIIGSFIMMLKNLISKNVNNSIIVIAGYLGNFAIIVLYIFERALSKRNKVKHISDINEKNQKKKFLEIYRKYLLLICVLITSIIYNLSRWA